VAATADACVARAWHGVNTYKQLLRLCKPSLTGNGCDAPILLFRRRLHPAVAVCCRDGRPAGKIELRQCSTLLRWGWAPVFNHAVPGV